jgi:hypothetical protein
VVPDPFGLRNAVAEALDVVGAVVEVLPAVVVGDPKETAPVPGVIEAELMEGIMLFPRDLPIFSFSK